MPKIKNLHYSKHSLSDNLKNFVKYAWIMKSQESKSKQDLLIPDGYPEIIFVQKGAYSKEFLAPNKAPIIISRSCIVGLQTQSVLASRMNNCHLIGLKMNPIGAYTLFGNRLKDVLDRNLSLDEFGVEWLSDLNEKLQNCEDETTILEVLSQALLCQVEKLEGKQINELADSFLASILSVKGQVSVQELAKQHCLSIRHFQRKFKDFFGISPKKFLNIIRFKYFYKASILQQKSPSNFLDYGYYDQMHFIKDFRRHLGINPSKSFEASFLQRNQMAQLNL